MSEKVPIDGKWPKELWMKRIDIGAAPAILSSPHSIWLLPKELPNELDVLDLCEFDAITIAVMTDDFCL